VEIHESARKHGIADEDVRHAVDFGLAMYELSNEGPYRWLVLGADRAGNLLEIVVLAFDDERLMAIHAMPMRPKYRELLP